MMDIVFLTDSMTIGGAETQLVRIATALKSRGWSVGILSMLPPNEFGDEIDKAGIPLVECEDHTPKIPIRLTYRIIRQLVYWRPQVLITFNYHADVMGRVCGRIAGVPVVIASLRTAHAKTALREKIYRFTEFLIDMTASNSQAAITYMLSRRLLTPRKTTVIPNGMITSDFPAKITREEARAEFAVAPETFFWLAVGTLRPAKDYPNLLAAVAQCAKVSSNFQMYIAGDGAHLDALGAEAAALGLEGIVHFLGSRSDIAQLFRACDAYVISSAWEGLPNTVMEAMASGVPVVATDVGGVRELIEPGVEGFLVPPGDSEALAEQMLATMALDADTLSAMGDRGRERIVSQFDNERVVDLWESQIREISPSVSAIAPRPIPAFVISLDFELLWGMRDKRTIETYGKNILGVREAIPAMLKLFQQYGVKATWATVGFVLFDNRKELLEYLPEKHPTYVREKLDPYRVLANIGENEKSDPYHYGLSLVRQVLDCEGMELGSHTFSHYYCLEKGQNAEQFRADLDASVAAIKRVADRPISLIFPRNQYNSKYLSVCSDSGFKVFRGNESAWMYHESMDQDQSAFQRGERLLDHYVNLSGHNGFIPRQEGPMINCPSSRFLRPFSEQGAWVEWLRLHRIRSAMEDAARSGCSFHLWWHPHNFGANLKENLATLENLLRFHVVLRERYGVVPMTMGDFSRSFEARKQRFGGLIPSS